MAASLVSPSIRASSWARSSPEALSGGSAPTINVSFSAWRTSKIVVEESAVVAAAARVRGAAVAVARSATATNQRRVIMSSCPAAPGPASRGPACPRARARVVCHGPAPRAGRPPLIKYLGSKRALLPRILEQIEPLAGVCAALDLFSGTARVGHALKARGYRVHANDHNAYAAMLATCYVQADRDRWGVRAGKLLGELDRLPGEAGWFTETFCVRARYLQPRNGARVDAIRERSAALAIEPELEAIALVSL